MNNRTTICPWCETEMVWDEVLGPEEHCPHCHNELSAYRGLNITIAVDERTTETTSTRQSSAEDVEQAEEKERSNSSWNEDSMLVSKVDTLGYQEKVNKVLHEQAEMPECTQCREYMIFVGQDTITVAPFTTNMPKQALQPMVQSPFQIDVYICSACFQVTNMLAHSYREPFMKNVRNTKCK